MSTFELTPAAFQGFSHALINPLRIAPEDWQGLSALPVVPDRYREQPALFPRLVELTPLREAERAELYQHAQRWTQRHDDAYFAALLRSQAPSERLRRHLVRQIDHYHLERRDYDVIRLHAPKVFRHLQWLLDAPQWERLLGPIEVWAWREPDGQWRQRLRDGRVERPAPRFDLSPQQWRSLLRLGAINRCLAVLARQAPELADTAELARRLEQALREAAERYQLGDREDRVLFAVQAARFGERIHQHPDLQKRLRQAREGSSSYLSACLDRDDAAMARLADELESPPRESA